MVMRKTINTKDAPIVLGQSTKDKELFPPGFRYRMGSLIFTVKGDCTQEASSPMREVFLSDGATEIVPVETLMKDVREITRSNGNAGEIMEPDQRFMPKKLIAQKKVVKKKVAKKTVKKKVTKKKINK